MFCNQIYIRTYPYPTIVSDKYSTFDFGHNCKGFPYEFWKNEKKYENFFLNFIPYIKMDQEIHYKNDLQTYLTPRVGSQ